MHAAGILTPGTTNVPYPAYVLIGSLMWGLFTSFYGAAAGTLSAGSGLIMQVNYPHEVLLFKQIAQQLTNFLISLVISLIGIAVFGVLPSWKIIFLPLIVLPLACLASALGLVVSMLSIVAVDISNGVAFLLGFCIYLIPILYSEQVANPVLAHVIHWNPLTYLVCSARDIILYGRIYGGWGFYGSSLVSIIVFMFSLRTFYLLEHKLIERII
jgi:lipopolysaccharide transport system permease protein